VEMDNDAPPLATILSNVHSGRIISRTLSRKLTARYRLRPSCRHLFIVDVEKRARFFGVNTLERLKQKSVEAALDEMHENPQHILQDIFGGWPEETPFRWALINQQIRLGAHTNPRIDEPLLMCGVAEEICASLESWSQSQGASPLAILPLPVAVLAWCNQVLPTKDRDSLVVVATEQGVVGAAFRQNNLIFISQDETVGDAFAVLEREIDALGLENPVRYLWGLHQTDDRRTIPEDLMIIDEENIARISGKSLELQEGHGKKIRHDHPLAHLLNWLVTQ
jgi:hypothetical protein